MMVSQDALAAIYMWARKQVGIKSIYIFGSRALGTARWDSDLDLAIELEGEECHTFPRSILVKAEWEKELSIATNYRVDLDFYAEYWCHVYSYVDETGLRIYYR